MSKPGKIKRIIGAVRKLVEDKEDTSQVFIILEALSGKSGERAYKRFLRTKYAEKILNAEKPLMGYLKDRAWLASLPEGSLGRAYHRFTELEQITADGLVEASEEGKVEAIALPEKAQIYMERQRDAHDLWHVVTGYGRDPLGELCLLAVTWRQSGNFGFLVIIGVGYRLVKKAAPHLKIGKAILEGFRIGKRSQWLPAADWERLLEMPLADVRAHLALEKPMTYHEAVTQEAELQTPGYVAAE